MNQTKPIKKEILMSNDTNDKMVEAVKCGLIIEQQSELLKELLPTIADEFGVTKSIAKKIIMSFAKDTLAKTQEKLEDERSSLANVEGMIEAIECITVDAESVLAETVPSITPASTPNGTIIS